MTICIWSDKGITLVKETPRWKINQALALVDQALNNEIGFCWRQVKRIPLASGTNIRNHITRLKRQLSEDTTLTDEEIHRLRCVRDQLIEEEREHYTYDITAMKSLKSNHEKLKRALKLLCAEGEVESYLLKGDGTLKVEYWSEYETTYHEHIVQSISWFAYDEHEHKWHHRDEKYLGTGELTNEIRTADLGLVENEDGELVQHNKHHGIDPAWSVQFSSDNKGAGEISTVKRGAYRTWLNNDIGQKVENTSYAHMMSCLQWMNS